MTGKKRTRRAPHSRQQDLLRWPWTKLLSCESDPRALEAQISRIALPGAILPARLEWLCQPEQIEHTLSLLFALNGWKRAAALLLFADREALQDVQILLLAHAYQGGNMQAVAYLDGTGQFPGSLLLDTAAGNAAGGVQIHLKSLCDPATWPPFWPEGDRVYQQYIRPLCKRITGKDFACVADAAEALEITQVRTYIQERLRKLVARAKQTRQPIPSRTLGKLCLAPVDVLPIRANRLYFFDGYDTWDDLTRADLRHLDPEGESQIALRYASPTAKFVFHLPFRQAGLFVPAERLRELQRTPGASQERGVYQGRLIDDAESLQRPVQEILADLGLEPAGVCPHRLVDKQTYLARPEIRDLLWPTRSYDQEDWVHDEWDGLCLPPTER